MVLGGAGKILKRFGKDKSPSDKSTAEWFQQEYNWVGFVAVSSPGKGKDTGRSANICQEQDREQSKRKPLSASARIRHNGKQSFSTVQRYLLWSLRIVRGFLTFRIVRISS